MPEKILTVLDATKVPWPTVVPHDDRIVFRWDTGRKCLDVEVYRDNTLSWFYRDRITRQIEGSEEDRIHELPDEAVTLLQNMFDRVYMN